jgi:hypothetical protein
VLGAKSVAYQLLNLSGAIGIMVVSWKMRAMQPAVLNLVWTVIAMPALVRMAL